MDAGMNELEGGMQARRSIRGGLLSIALIAIAATFLSSGPMRAVTILGALAAIFFAFRGLPDALVEYASQRRSTTYMKVASYLIPIGLLLLSVYAVWLLWTIRSSDLQIEAADIPLVLIALVGLVNMVVLIVNAITPD